MNDDFFVNRLKRSEIDNDKWNDLIDSALLSKSYLYSWALDVVSPHWEALVLNDYDAAFVLPIKKRLGINYIIQPNFVQQLGCITKNTNKKFINYCLNYIKKHFIYYKINLNEIDTEIISMNVKSNMRVNVLKKINGNVSDFDNYNNNTKRNIAKFYTAGYKVSEIKEYDKIIELFRKDKGTELELTNYHYSLLTVFFDAFRNHNKLIICAAEVNNETVAGAIFISSPKISTFIFSGNSAIGKKNGAMHALIDYYIKNYMLEGQILDFEGSVSEGLSQFYLGFGGEKKKYLQIKRF